MPVGDSADPHSASGIMAQLSGGMVVVAISDTTDEGSKVVGCVLGSLLDDSLIEGYRLRRFGANDGDGLLAYIGVAPEFQGARGFQGRCGYLDEVCAGTPLSPKPTGSSSIASVLFSTWLRHPEISPCSAVFVRTRATIRPVLHLLDRHGFEHRGQFELDFRGSVQTRLVYCRRNDD